MDIHNATVKELVRHFREIALLVKIKATLDWDLNVNMPPKASEGRSHQTSYIQELLISKWMDKDFLEKLDAMTADQKELSQEEKAIIRNLNYASSYYRRVPEEIIIQKEKVTSQAFVVWKKAREENRFQDFLPYLKEIVALERIIANHLGFTENPYDALLHLHEQELTAAHTKSLFDPLKKELTALLEKIKKSPKYQPHNPLRQSSVPYDITAQEALSRYMATQMGYDFQAGRLDVAPHPFTTTLDHYDIRITTRYHEHDFIDAYTSTVHETGHALYEQDVNPAYVDTPLDYGVSYGIHEALSRFWENIIGKNPQLLTHLAPEFANRFPTQLTKVSVDDIIMATNNVRPSFIRVEADEVTYSLHIILRFEMENALINGDIAIEDAAEAWKEKSQELFGVAPEKDSEGILQDVHWTYGSFGYFPSYALGNLYGAQFLHSMKKEVSVDTDLAKGELRNVKTWLAENIHTHGSLYWPKELVKKVTGEPLDAKYFVEYLKNKYSLLYTL